MVLLLVFMQLTHDLFVIAKFLLILGTAELISFTLLYALPHKGHRFQTALAAVKLEM